MKGWPHYEQLNRRERRRWEIVLLVALLIIALLAIVCDWSTK